MKNPPAQSLQCFLLLRVCDTVRLRLCRQCAAVCLDCPAPRCFQFDSGCLGGAPVLQDVRTEPLKRGCGCCLRGVLCLPVSLRLCRDCEFFTICGVIRTQVEAVLRAPVCPETQFLPQAELCVLDVQLQDGCLCAVFDLTASIHAAVLQPVQLPVLAAPCLPDCSPFGGLPLYPELAGHHT